MGDPQHKRRVDEPSRSRDLQAGTELERPDGGGASMVRALQQQAGNTAVAGLLGGNKGSGGQAAPQSGGFEAALFDVSILGPMRSLYACVRDVPPDYELALQHLERVGQTLNDYSNRYADKDPGVAEGFVSALGWLSRVRDVVLRRVGQGKEMTDDGIATNVQAVLEGLNALQGRIH